MIVSILEKYKFKITPQVLSQIILKIMLLPKQIQMLFNKKQIHLLFNKRPIKNNKLKEILKQLLLQLQLHHKLATKQSILTI